MLSRSDIGKTRAFKCRQLSGTNVFSYIYIGHEVRICRGRRTTSGWTGYDKLRDVFKSDISVKLKREAHSHLWCYGIASIGKNTTNNQQKKWSDRF